jgi:hypothetical protein
MSFENISNEAKAGAHLRPLLFFGFNSGPSQHFSDEYYYSYSSKCLAGAMAKQVCGVR